MKIISLNTWGGRAGHDPLLQFFRDQADTTDIFCLQEMWRAPYEHLEGIDAGGLALKHKDVMTEGLQRIAELLPTYAHYFHPHHDQNYGLAIFVRKEL